jgi:hypothetical protein
MTKLENRGGAKMKTRAVFFLTSLFTALLLSSGSIQAGICGDGILNESLGE